MSQNKRDIEYEISSSEGFSFGFSEIKRYKELFFFFTWRDIKVKYKQTVLGFLWAVLQPFLMMMIFVLFFSSLLNVPTDNIPPPIFYFSGLLYWNLFSSSLTGAANSMVENSNIIKKVYFPRLIIPTSSILVALFDFLMAFVVFIGIYLYYLWFKQSIDFQPSILLYMPLALFLVILFSLGLGSLLAAFNVKYRDFRYIIPFLIQFLMFVSPVIYPISIFKEALWAKYIMALNPLTGVMNLARAGFTDTPLNWILIGISFLSALIIFIIGIAYFKKTEAYFADIA